MNIGMLIFPDMTQLDFTGPYEVFAQLPDCQVKVISKSLEPVAAKGGLRFLPDTTLASCPPLDLVFVPGGPGTGALLEDREVLEFLRRQSADARYVTSVCTGALVLGAAGLLKGYRATTHWLSLELLAEFGALPMPDRVVTDRNRITGGGVTAGIDFALAVAAEVAGIDKAKAIQLLIEYNPAPPFSCGHPDTADAGIVGNVRSAMAPLQQKRLELARRAARLFC
ncbi:MAG: DJ-1/PfpI family protein [Proteobacteria bacterium]|nr:DJ-1/PfpI family protein [Pseudomonadota bacterium]